jgi:hypothetical protein
MALPEIRGPWRGSMTGAVQPCRGQSQARLESRLYLNLIQVNSGSAARDSGDDERRCGRIDDGRPAHRAQRALMRVHFRGQDLHSAQFNSPLARLEHCWAFTPDSIFRAHPPEAGPSQSICLDAANCGVCGRRPPPALGECLSRSEAQRPPT